MFILNNYSINIMINLIRSNIMIDNITKPILKEIYYQPKS
jgi:hypothetical protein